MSASVDRLCLKDVNEGMKDADQISSGKTDEVLKIKMTAQENLFGKGYFTGYTKESGWSFQN